MSTSPAELTPETTERHLHRATQVVLIMGLALALLCLAVRLQMKFHLIGTLNQEDICLAIACIFCVATQVIILYALDNAGLGVHIRHLTQDTVSQYQKLLLAASCLFVTGVGLARLSHLIFFHRLMAAKHWLRYFLLLMMAFIISGSFALICCFVFACRPVSKAWDVAISGRCMDRPAIFLAVAVSNIVSDLCLIALPVPLISGLHLSLSQKVRFAILFSLVCVTFVASAIRLRLTIPLLGSEDLTYAMAPVALLVGVESNLIIIAASLPAMRQLCHLVSSRLSLAEGLSTEPNARRWSAGL
ncbi:hypothetical protein BJX66DRAFT_330289 [Aspergillus keveii]|uniref:Rhodopsin domain-containing protein n=1 Tax=Aspergillus keveii TaxID=714993 RepID=A0ABR4FL64_9EURO